MAFSSRFLKSSSGWGMVSLGVRLCSLAILLPLTTRMVPAAELGYWYLFANLYALMVVLDFGVTSATARTLGMLLAELHTSDEKQKHRDHIAAFLGSCRTAYVWITILTFFGLGICGGWWIWRCTVSYADAQTIRYTWLMACPVFVLAVVANFGRALLAGSNQITVFQFLSACAFAIQFFVGAAGLMAGWGIRALIAANFAMFATLAGSLFFALWHPGNLAEAGPWKSGTASTMRMLLKIAAGTFSNNLSSYIVLNANILIASHFLSIVGIASYGLSLQIILIAAQASTVWLEVKGPLFAQWFRTDLDTLRRVFVQRMRLAILTYTGCILGAALLGPQLLAWIGSQTPILGPAFFGVLAVMVFLVMHAAQFDAFCMALGHNPFVKPYLISAVSGVGFAIALAPALGLWAVVLGPLTVQLAWNGWWVPMEGLRLLQMTPREYLSRLFFVHRAYPTQNE